MMKYLVALLVALLTVGGLVSAQDEIEECTDCYANIITQVDSQSISNVRLGLQDDAAPVTTVAVGNEGLSAAIIVTQAPTATVPGALFIAAPFARIDQTMTQSISNLGSEMLADGEGAKGVTWNKAIQAAWIANQGVKELEDGVYVKEGSLIQQSTTQTTDNVYDYASREAAKVLNVDNKLAMIVDDMEAVIALTASATSSASDTQASYGVIDNSVNIDISSTDP